MSPLEIFIQQAKEFLGIPDTLVPVRIEKEEESLRDSNRDDCGYDPTYGPTYGPTYSHDRRPHR